MEDDLRPIDVVSKGASPEPWSMSERLSAFDRLSSLEQRLTTLKAHPWLSQAGTPLLQLEASAPLVTPCLSQSPQLEAPLPSSAQPMIVGGLSGDLSEPMEPCVDFDYCFKFASPVLVDYLRDEAQKTEGISYAQKKARQKAVDDAVSKSVRENEWLRSELEKRRKAKSEGKPRQRFPSQSPDHCKASTALGPIPSDDINELFGDFFREKRDREALTCNGQATSMQDAQVMALSVLLDFFGREEERYQTFVFRSVDCDEIFLCVRMCEDTAATHADKSDFMVELSQEEVATQLNVRIPDEGPHPPAYAHYKEYLAQSGLIKGQLKESNADRKTLFTKVDRIALIYDRMTDVLDLDAMKSWNLLQDFYPVHTLARLLDLRANFTQGKWLFKPPVDDIRDYFGSQIALYFVFSSCLCRYLCWLLLGSFIGSVYVTVKSRSISEALSGFLYGHRHADVRSALALFTIIWTQAFLFSLKREVEWSLVKWGEGHHLGFSSVKPRESPRFQAAHCQSDVDSNIEELTVPMKTRKRGRQESQVLTSIFAIIVCVVMASIYLGAAWLDGHGYEFGFPAAGYAITAAIKISQAIWSIIAIRLVDIEYHHYEVDYFDSWSSKTVVIQMICNFSPFVYVGFVMKTVDRCPTGAHYGDCFGYLCYEMVIVFLLYIVFTLWDIIYPVVVIKVHIYLEARDAKRRGTTVYNLSFLEKQAKMDEYDSACQAEDYCEHIMPLAFVVLFGITLPCSPILALISSWLQMRADAFKLTTAMQRPFPVRAKQGLGIWAQIIDSIALLAVYSNVGIISSMLEPFCSSGWRSQWLAFFSLSTAVLALRKVVDAHLPVEDHELKMAIKRQIRQMEVVHRVQEHHMESLIIRKPTVPHSHGQAQHPTPEEMLQRAEAGMKPLRLTIALDLNLKNIQGLESDSSHFETF